MSPTAAYPELVKFCGYGVFTMNRNGNWILTPYITQKTELDALLLKYQIQPGSTKAPSWTLIESSPNSRDAIERSQR